MKREHGEWRMRCAEQSCPEHTVLSEENGRENVMNWGCGGVMYAPLFK